MLASTEAAVPSPLTRLSDEERMFQSTVRRFAREQIAPHVREMDEAGVFRKDIIRQFFDLGLMGIEIPEEFGGQGGSFFQCVMAVEELSAVDPSAGVIVDVQNTIVNNAILRWAGNNIVAVEAMNAADGLDIFDMQMKFPGGGGDSAGRALCTSA